MQKEISYFNPRLREGGDIGKTNTGKTYTDFNPRLREGGDTSRQFLHTFPTSFQSTPPRRRRQKETAKKTETKEFQSTPPRRRRHSSTGRYGDISAISIHASEKEATATYCDTSTIMYISSLNNFFVHYF